MGVRLLSRWARGPALTGGSAKRPARDAQWVSLSPTLAERACWCIFNGELA
jgi:hypothetical protein